MLVSEWYQQTVPSTATRVKQLTCVILPFIKLPGLIESIFPHSRISYVSLIPRPGTNSPALSPDSKIEWDIPFLALHTKLIRSYWAVLDGWKPWDFLEGDFAALRSHGFRFAKGADAEYHEVVRSAASQFAAAVAENAKTSGAEAIVVYGRGHWTMNAAALAAKKLGLRLFVIERGILPNSYIVDLDIPFTAPGSQFRQAWQSFRSVDYHRDNGVRRLSESSWDLYDRLLNRQKGQRAGANQHFRKIIVGQCLFDFNCLDASFNTPLELVERVLDTYPELQSDADVCYRPHPLSPEEYSNGVIHTHFRVVNIERSAPWDALGPHTVLYTWNSTLGLEAKLVFNSTVRILDADCHYSWINSCSRSDEEAYIHFLNEYSVFQ